MTDLITGIVLIGIAIYCAVIQIPEKKRQKQEYLDNAEYWAMRGEREVADKYYEAAAKLK